MTNTLDIAKTFSYWSHTAFVDHKKFDEIKNPTRFQGLRSFLTASINNPKSCCCWITATTSKGDRENWFARMLADCLIMAFCFNRDTLSFEEHKLLNGFLMAISKTKVYLGDEEPLDVEPDDDGFPKIYERGYECEDSVVITQLGITKFLGYEKCNELLKIIEKAEDYLDSKNQE